MGAGDEARKVVQWLTGMWWPAADEGNLRAAAAAYRQMASAVEDAAAIGDRGTRDVVGQNTGPAIDAFGRFWGRYKSGAGGWLPDSAQACRQMADALDWYAEGVAHAKRSIEEAVATVGAVLVAGTALAFFTAGLSEVAAGAAAVSVMAVAESAGIALSGVVADVIGTAMAGAVFGTVESVALDLAVVQPVRVGFGDAKAIDFGEALEWGAGGALFGGAFGASVAALRGVSGLSLSARQLAELKAEIQSAAGLQRQELIEELTVRGIKHNPADIVRIFRAPNGKIVFLENGNTRSGLQHIVENHGSQFVRKGLSIDEIPDVLQTALTDGKIVGQQGHNRAGRPIYEFTYKGHTYQVSITISDNGYLVGANPSR